ncbi:glycerol kinase GlpK [Agromyces sp. C10]|uniref:FGGY family carbohydrate kinase n=1 Tax=Agromyces sp. C10 TaxID=2935077 RepID=UPI002009F40C|nr:glycerol kinase GlpK [Agromyces sp. C10]MCK8610119.1 glycerol kinase GlpK [Agromyces sp. C10]
MTGRYVLALDEGSSSARAVLVDERGETVAESSEPISPIFPRPDWVELDPAELWGALERSIARTMVSAGATAADIAAIGLTTHRETSVIWDRATGRPVHNAVMWMSKQTDDIVREWSESGFDPEFRRRTGLRNDSYFSAGKIAWLLENVPGVRADAERGRLAVGTVDSWLLWNLTGGAVHATDPSSASRTALLDLAGARWDDEFCEILGIPTSLLPDIRPSDGWFGDLAPGILPGPMTHPIPVRGILGDQQAGLFGQACLAKGSAKNTYGTAGVLTVNVGDRPQVMPGMTSSVAWQFGDRVTYEAEGVVFHSGQTLQWLRDQLGILSHASRSESIAQSVDDNGGVYLVPAFAGLCDPYWDRDVRAAIVGLTLDTHAAHVVRAALESMAYQTRDNIDALERGGVRIPELRVDGGAVANDFLCQFQADILGIPVARPRGLERTALGVAHVAGAGVGMWTLDEIGERWERSRRFEPRISADERDELYDGWRAAVEVARALPARRRTGTAVPVA